MRRASAKGARLHFRTDHEPYFREAAVVLREHADWVQADAATLPFEEPTVFQKARRALFYPRCDPRIGYKIVMRKTVAILVFDDVEVLDFAGPFEVFAVADELMSHSAFNVVTVAPRTGVVRAQTA